MENSVDNLKKVILSIFDYVVSICKKYNIDYFMTYGSLLGSVREHTIIPWDDDVDIGMTYENMLKLKAAVQNEKNEKYRFIFPFENDSPFLLAKCYDTSTTLKERFLEKTESVCLDIDVYFPVSKEKIENKIFTDKKKLLWCHRMYSFKTGWISSKTHNSLKWKISSFLSLFYSKKALLKRIKTICINEEARDYFVFFHDKMNAYEYNDILALLETPFENRIVTIPRCYDEMLSNLYGSDYMIPWPPEKRPRSNTGDFDLNNGFIPNDGRLL